MWADLKLNPDNFFPRAMFNFLTREVQKYIPECIRYIQVGLLIENFCGKYRECSLTSVLAALDLPTAAGNKWETIKFTRGEVAILSTTTFRLCF